MRPALVTLLLLALPQPAVADCGIHPRARALAELIAAHPEQQREALVCDPRLAAFAQARATDMVLRGYFGHVDPDNVGPNQRLRELGFPLPDAYLDGRNNSIESILGGLADPDDVLRALLRSSRHRTQVLGEETFFRVQDRYGIGYVADPATERVDHWVIVFAREATEDDPYLNCTPPPGACFEVSRR